jgi:hypothetical protein
MLPFFLGPVDEKPANNNGDIELEVFEQVSMPENFFFSSLMARANKLERLSLAGLSNLVLDL